MSLRFGGEDSEIGQRLVKLGHTILNAPQVLSIHRGASGGGTREHAHNGYRAEAGRIADRALIHASVDGPLVGALSLGKYLLRRLASQPRDLLPLVKESVTCFCRNLPQNTGKSRPAHLQLAKNLYTAFKTPVSHVGIGSSHVQLPAIH